MAFFLLEIGTEELPADFARLALPQLEEQLGQHLSHGTSWLTCAGEHKGTLGGVPQLQLFHG
ncbi:MAG: hypothetical protein ACKOPT_09950 [Cyanobium sp.]